MPLGLFFIFQNFVPSIGEVGGCPFKQFDSPHLSELLNMMEINEDTKQTIELQLLKNQQYSLACCVVLDRRISNCMVCSLLLNANMEIRLID